MNYGEKVTDFADEYSPSMHTKRFQDYESPNKEVLKHFVKISQQATTLARELYKTRLNVRYGGKSDNQLLDIYYKDKEEGLPIFVYIHGGFWQELDKTTSGPIVHTLIEHYRIILVDYDVCPRVTLLQLTQQISNFFKWLSVYAKETGAPKISICGHSAGAHLALQMFQSEFLQAEQRLNAIDNVFLISGLYDLQQLWSFETCNPNNLLSLNPNLAIQLSPQCCNYNNKLIGQYKAQEVKIHIITGEHDSEAFKRQSQNYAYKLTKLNMDVNYRMFRSYDHFDIIEECSQRNSAISRYIRKELGIY
uniref:Alpha/beta hydrolase fold-3 domain-containing protein n=1 Tax=Stomoxys calcitrans TaxID=35570 RepID=A0A1I8P783_STOCA